MHDSTFLCHKCGGALTGDLPGLFGCGCISGWVRDWQEPSEDPYEDQIRQSMYFAQFHEERGDTYKAGIYLAQALRIERHQQAHQARTA